MFYAPNKNEGMVLSLSPSCFRTQFDSETDPNIMIELCMFCFAISVVSIFSNCMARRSFHLDNWFGLRNNDKHQCLSLPCFLVNVAASDLKASQQLDATN